MLYTLSQRRELLGKLPQLLQDAILSFDNMEAIQKVAETHHLHIDQATELDDEVSLVMLGLTPLEQFAKNIASRVQVSEREAEAIATEIDAHVLQKIKHELMEATASPHVQEVIKNSTAAKVLGHPVDTEVPEEKVSREQALHELETPPSVRIRETPQKTPVPVTYPVSTNLPEIKPEQELVLPQDNPPAWLLEQFKESTTTPAQPGSPVTRPVIRVETPKPTPPLPPPNPLYKPPMPELSQTPPQIDKGSSIPTPALTPPPANKLNSIQQAPKATMDMHAAKKPSTPYNTDPYREPIE